MRAADDAEAKAEAARKAAGLPIEEDVATAADDKHGSKKGKLVDNFYKKTCPSAEDTVREVIAKHAKNKPTLGAKLLRLHYHDCFVRGCDGSILLDSTKNSPSEKEGIPNLTLEGYDIIEEIKTEIEKKCKQVVSCADILALAARDAVSFNFGRSMWKVVTGRRDGTISKASETLPGLPSPFSNFTTLKNVFDFNGLSTRDLVALSGAHTIGVAHCSSFRKRLFNFTGTGDQDPSLDKSYAAFLKTKCKNPNDKKTTTEMDPGSFVSFDNQYFLTLMRQKGLFQSDVALLTNKDARQIAQQLLKPKKFFDQFAISMQNMGAIQVLTGVNGEIRKRCKSNSNRRTLHKVLILSCHISLIPMFKNFYSQ
ncbi:peroxidase 3-like [Silene latifolia]|uniref:peroxidase 3-like n=1 Tax=Silene latifolia TaxID=37657 RepID=UPI003D784CAF